MTDFSASGAIGAGFRLVGRNPLALLAWAGLYFVLGIGPSMLLWSRMTPLAEIAARGDAAVPRGELASEMSAMWAWMPLTWLTSFILASVLYGAIYRAILEPEDNRFFYLRLGGRELWLGLTMFALLILLLICSAIIAITVVLIGHNTPAIVTFVASLAAVATMIWLGMRFSLATSLAFAERRFIFLESWTLTEGHALKLFGVALALLGIVLLAEVVLVVPIGIAFGASAALSGHLENPAAMLEHASPLILVGGLLLSLFAAFVYAILGAPWVDIYRQLASRPTD